MTDQGLIKALRCCGKVDDLSDCPNCPREEVSCGYIECVMELVSEAADRLKTLLADKAALGREIDRQICKRSELEREIGRLEVERDHFRDLTKKMWCEKQYGEDINAPTKWVSVDEQLPPENVRVLVYLKKDLQRYTLVDTDRLLGDIWVRWHGRVTHWMPLPEPPRTEVE